MTTSRSHRLLLGALTTMGATLLLAVSAMAQATGRIEGWVRDDEGQPLVRATVTASGLRVTAEPPALDVTANTTGLEFTEELFSTLPTARTFSGLPFFAPGVTSGGLGGNPSVRGASAAENRYVIDGLDTTDPAFGTLGPSLPLEFVQNVEVKTGGYEAEYGGALGGLRVARTSARFGTRRSTAPAPASANLRIMSTPGA